MNKKYIKPLAKIIRLRCSKEENTFMRELDIEYRPLQPIGVTVDRVVWRNISEDNMNQD